MEAEDRLELELEVQTEAEAESADSAEADSAEAWAKVADRAEAGAEVADSPESLAQRHGHGRGRVELATGHGHGRVELATSMVLGGLGVRFRRALHPGSQLTNASTAFARTRTASRMGGARAQCASNMDGSV